MVRHHRAIHLAHQDRHILRHRKLASQVFQRVMRATARGSVRAAFSVKSTRSVLPISVPSTKLCLGAVSTVRGALATQPFSIRFASTRRNMATEAGSAAQTTTDMDYTTPETNPLLRVGVHVTYFRSRCTDSSFSSWVGLYYIVDSDKTSLVSSGDTCWRKGLRVWVSCHVMPCWHLTPTYGHKK